jgi:hypothetical protein
MSEEEMDAATKHRRMVIQVGYNYYAMDAKDAITILEAFQRSVKVDQAHTANYQRSVWVPSEDQTPPIDSATLAEVVVPAGVDGHTADVFGSATRAVSGGTAP